MFALDRCDECVLSSDALLPTYTPNVGGADVRVERSLERYLETLRSIIDAEYEVAFPGHRAPITDPASRAHEIIHHHEERALKVLEAVDASDGADTWTVSAELFGELESIHILHGPGEAHAHLDHLHRNGEIELDDGTYHLTSGTSERLRDRRVEGEWPLSGDDVAA